MCSCFHFLWYTMQSRTVITLITVIFDYFMFGCLCPSVYSFFESFVTLVTISYGFLVNGSKGHHMIQNFHYINNSCISIHHVWISCNIKILIVLVHVCISCNIPCKVGQSLMAVILHVWNACFYPVYFFKVSPHW